MKLILFLLLTSLIPMAYADTAQIFIDQNKAVGKESVIQITTYDTTWRVPDKESMFVEVEVNGQYYNGTSNYYGYIAFPIKLTDNVYEAGLYDVKVTVGENVFNRILKVIKGGY